MMDLQLFMTERQKAIRDEYEPLLERRRELRAEYEEVTKKLGVLKKELDEIERAEQAIAGNVPDRKMTLTIKEAVVRVLDDEKRGMTAQQILVAINDRFFDGAVVRSSLSPQLSRLNYKDKKIKFDGTLWSLRSPNEEGPENSEPSFLD